MFAVDAKAVLSAGEAEWLYTEVGSFGVDWDFEWRYGNDGKYVEGKRFLFVRDSDAVAYALRWL